MAKETTNVKIPATIVSPANLIAVLESANFCSELTLFGINRPKFTYITNFVTNLRIKMRVLLPLFISIFLFSCAKGTNFKARKPSNSSPKTTEISLYKPKKTVFVKNGDLQMHEYVALLKGKKVGLVVNQSSMIGKTHLIDSLIALEINVKKIFAPEHGVRGNADAGELVSDDVDAKTGLPIISLYGNHKKPTMKDLDSIDVLVFDLQDVGVRFFTYISTMHYVMEACAEKKIPLIILDRPNPNGDYVAGPVLDTNYRSFIGMHPIPIVHGLTVGELALMINGEKWLKDSLKTDLHIIKCKNYTHDSIIPLAIKPSPNLTNLNAIRWYPSICLFEETQVSVGRGTLFPFEVYGGPQLDSSKYVFSFTPISIHGMSKSPPFMRSKCYGEDFRNTKNTGTLRLDLIYNAHKNYKGNAVFFGKKNFSYKLFGTNKIIDAIEAGKSLEEIEDMCQMELENYKIVRKKYLLYPDFHAK